VLKHTENTAALMADISEGALSVARKNAERLSLSARAEIVSADVLGADFHSFLLENGPWDAVLCNPPYIPEDVYRTLAPEIFFEPEGAFVGAEGGMAFYRILIPALLPCLKEGGFIAFEIGYDQAERMRALAEKNALAAEILSDLSGHARVAVLKKRA
jgi:release factor glutamine methyltransferase